MEIDFGVFQRSALSFSNSAPSLYRVASSIRNLIRSCDLTRYSMDSASHLTLRHAEGTPSSFPEFLVSNSHCLKAGRVFSGTGNYGLAFGGSDVPG